MNTVRVVTGREGQAVALEVLIVVTSRYQQTIAGQVCFIVGLDVHVLVLVPQRVQRPLKSDGGYKVSQSRGYEVVNVLGRHIGQGQQPVSIVILLVLLTHPEEVLGRKADHGTRMIFLSVLRGLGDGVVLEER